MCLRKSQRAASNKTEFRLTNVLSAPKTCSSSASCATVVCPIWRRYVTLSSDVPCAVSVLEHDDCNSLQSGEDVWLFREWRNLSGYVTAINGGKPAIVNIWNELLTLTNVHSKCRNIGRNFCVHWWLRLLTSVNVGSRTSRLSLDHRTFSVAWLVSFESG
jgi:hypothetical protein